MEIETHMPENFKGNFLQNGFRAIFFDFKV